jgi:chemotaxis protein histidine kinase CheA
MLNSVQQGIFTIDESLAIQPQYSGHLEQLLGARDIAGAHCLKMLFEGSTVSPDALAAMDTALQFSFGVPSFLADVNAAHLVREFCRPNADGEMRIFEVDWHSITGDDGNVNAILVALRDMTVLRKLNEKVAQKGRELDVVGEILEAGLGAFNELCRSARVYLEENTAIIQSRRPLTGAALEQMFRNIHTIKGHARLLGLSHLVNSVHHAEEAFGVWRNAPDVVPDRQRLAADAADVQAVLEQYVEIGARRLGELTPPENVWLDQLLTEVESLADSATGLVDGGEVLRGVRKAAERARAIALRTTVKEVARMLPSLGRELDKPPPTVDYAGHDLTLTGSWGSVMRDALVHVFRNAIDHGIESRDERRARGKAPQGRILVHVEHGRGRTVVRVADDGRGLAVDSLRQKLGKLDASDDQVADQTFLSGVSSKTELSAVSGRGVGLDAVRTFVRERGGDVQIRFSGERHEGTRAFELVFELPADAVVITSPAPGRWGEGTPAVTTPAENGTGLPAVEY